MFVKAANVSWKLTPAIFKIILTEGSDMPGCLYLGSGDLSLYADERELLFTEGSRFNMTDKKIVAI